MARNGRILELARAMTDSQSAGFFSAAEPDKQQQKDSKQIKSHGTSMRSFLPRCLARY
jgi:hypothetical protein